ncbi:RNA-directed DNA polymerase, eukaryota, reverse transcriptase zinc-binding domain protein [Tanacetum coccineum]
MGRVVQSDVVLRSCDAVLDIVVTVSRIGEDIDGMGLEFTSSCVGEVGDGRDIRFWVDSWVDNRRLYDRFPSIFHLDSRKEGSVMDKISDRWRWSLGEDIDFKVKILTSLIEEKILQVENDGHDTCWNKLVPKKVNVFVWRAIKGRLMVRLELKRRGIDLDLVLCVCCNDSVETCTHCIVTCDLAMSVWTKLFNWWKVGNVNAFTIEELFSRNGNVDVYTSIDYGVRLDDIPIMCDNKGAIDLKNVSSEDNIADILTKPLKHELFNCLRLGLGMMEQID